MKTKIKAFYKAVVRNIPFIHGRAVLNREIETIRTSGQFDSNYYLAMYPDINKELYDPIWHYCKLGWREGKNPSDDFDTLGYLGRNPDIKKADINPFVHYIVAGMHEGRKGHPSSEVTFEDGIFFPRLTTDIQLIAYFSQPDWEVRETAHRADKQQIGKLLMPHDTLGVYQSMDITTLKNQAHMAQRHGISAWCFPISVSSFPPERDALSVILEHKDIAIRFCLDILVNTKEVHEQWFEYLHALFADSRYLRVDEQPLLITTIQTKSSEHVTTDTPLYRFLEHLSPPQPYLIARSDGTLEQTIKIATHHKYKAVLDFPVHPVPGETGSFQPLNKNGIKTVPYSVVVSQAVKRIQLIHTSQVPLYRTITLGWDDRLSGSEQPLRYTRFHLKEYRRWLDAAMAEARNNHDQDRRFVFINAWNDWNQGAVLEPDKINGFAKLNETARTLLNYRCGQAIPKVSVIVPNYNHAQYLHRRLNSIYKQTYPNIEVLLLDDCSTDESQKILNKYADQYPKITITLFNRHNSGGVFHQWAKGIQTATGNLIWIAESDDYCDEDFLEKLVPYFDDEAVMLAYSKIEFVRADESVMKDHFWQYVSALECRDKWSRSYVKTAHSEVSESLGIINTIPNASGTIFRRPVDMPLLNDEKWLCLRVAGDWIFYLHVIRGGKIAFSAETTNYFRRHDSSVVATTSDIKAFCKEANFAGRTVHALYNVPDTLLEEFIKRWQAIYNHLGGKCDEEFVHSIAEEQIREARLLRTPNILVSTMGFYPGGAEILPIRMANELKRQGHSVLMLSAGFGQREEGVCRMLRNDIPVVETPDIENTKHLIHDFGIEVLNSHQWYVQQYPFHVPDVFLELKAHAASLHGMIECGNTVSTKQLKTAHENVTTWVYTADKNLEPFIKHGLYTKASDRFVKLPNGMEPPDIQAVPRAEIGVPDNAFVLCCVSRAIAEKGWREAIEATSMARELSGKDIRLILVGNGPVYDELDHSRVPDFVYLAGFSENSVGHYATADMGIMLTRFKSESFPLTIVDCLFAGKPYISCDVGEIRNMLTKEDKIAGAVVTLSNWEIPVQQVATIISEYASDPEKYSAASAMVPKLASRYRIDNVVHQYVKLFQDSVAAQKHT
ncbi:MAG: glycosyltransferase [Desulfobulbus oligotrophicus]|jgi:glycosyltransferase involved in cell wall biosynthesis|nr:glycosyltransferase [Desulfobulbus oligotrophicus]